MSYELGSQIAKGLELCADMDTRHRQEGRMAYHCGDTSGLWSAMHWIGYNEASINAQVKLWTGDPAAARWQAEGAPSVVQWGQGCKMCAYTGEGWRHGTLGGDGWTGEPCPHCVPGGELFLDVDALPDDQRDDFVGM